MYGANDASCTSAGMTSCPLTRFCIVPASSTSHIRKRRLSHRLFSYVARLRSDAPANQILRICTKARDGERPSQEWIHVPVVDYLPPGSTRSAATRVSQWLSLCSYRRTDRSGERSQRRKASRAVARMWKTRRQRRGSGDRVPQRDPGVEPRCGCGGQSPPEAENLSKFTLRKLLLFI